MSFVVHRVAKHAARYTDAGGREKCGYCRFFVAPRSCGKVIGPVSPAGWCKYFSRQMVSQYGGGGTPIGGPSLPPGVTLDLNFMQPGTLDPRITFTRASPASYQDASGVIQTAAVDQPRWDYAGGSLRGLLLEDQGTNLLSQSGNLAAAPWSPLNFTVAAPVVTGNNATSPDGTLTAARIVYPAVSVADTGSVIYESFTATAAPYTISLYLKGSVGGEQLYLALQDGGSTWYRARVTLTTQWQRFTATTGTLTAATWYFEIGADLRDAGQTSTPAQTIYAWGAQSEPGSRATSYIPTTSAAVTRSRDSLRFPPASMTPWFASPGGTWFAEFISFVSASTNNRLIGVPNPGGIAPVFIGSSLRLSQFDNTILAATSGTATPDVVHKGVTSYAASVGKVCLDGGTVTSGALSGGYTQLASTGFGVMTNDNANGPENLPGCIRRISYWPRTLTDAEMQQVTT